MFFRRVRGEAMQGKVMRGKAIRGAAMQSVALRGFTMQRIVLQMRQLLSFRSAMPWWLGMPAVREGLRSMDSLPTSRIFRLRSIFHLARASTRLPSIRPAMRETLLLRWTFCMRFAANRGFAFRAASPSEAGHCCRAWRTSPAWAPPAAACRRRPTSSSMPCVQVATRRSSR